MRVALDICIDHLWVKGFDVLNVARSLLGVRVGLILCQNLVDGSSLIFAETCNHTSSAVLALIAVNVHRLVDRVTREYDRVANGLDVHLSAFLIRSYAEVVALDTVHDHELVEFLAWFGVDQGADL